MLISFEGIDGCGKTTQIKRLSTALEEKGYEVLVCREPGGTDVSEMIRAILLNPELEINEVTETLLFSAARSQVIKEIVLPALQNGKIVIMDRFYDSTTAYQGYARKALPLEQIHTLNKIASHGVVPDLTFYLRVSLEASLKRRADRQEDRMEQSGKEFYERTILGFDVISREEDRVISIESERKIQEISNEIINIVTSKLA